MSEMNDGGQAFPVAEIGTHGTYGMSLRDWFAGQALGAMVADGLGEHSYAEMAEWAYDMADAMLAARLPAPPAEEPR